MTQYSLRKKEKRNLYYVLQCNSVRTTIPELCGMCPLTASDWNLHSLNNCSTQSVVVYCHSESKSSADHNTGSTQREKRDQSSVAVLKARQSVHYWCKGIKTAYSQIFAGVGYKCEKTLFKNACVRIIFLRFTQHHPDTPCCKWSATWATVFAHLNISNVFLLGVLSLTNKISAILPKPMCLCAFLRGRYVPDTVRHIQLE